MSLSEERLARIRLARSGGIGPITYRALMSRFGSAEAAISAMPMLAARGGQRRAPVVAEPASIEAECERVARMGGAHLILGDVDYPDALAAIETAPPVLVTLGERALLRKPMVAMVGARNASAAACRLARGLARDLGGRGFVVVSGLARGIDTAAHQGALEDGTIGVVAGGADVVYPPENAGLQQEIAARGLLLAEMPPGTEPRARHFPHRNRIIAGLSAGTVVVEAAPKSGSLITARLAAEAGREVMAVPGSPLDPRAQGCNQLIRDGATLVQSAADVAESLQPIAGGMVAASAAGWQGPVEIGEDASDRDRQAVSALLGPVPVAVDEIVRQAGLAPATVQLVLLELELGGRLERHAGGRVSTD